MALKLLRKLRWVNIAPLGSTAGPVTKMMEAMSSGTGGEGRGARDMGSTGVG
jgi:hypothetical protein